MKSNSVLVGGFKHVLFSTIYGMSSFPLTSIFFKMVKTTNQYRNMRYQFIESYGDVLGIVMGITWNFLNLRKNIVNP